MTSPSITKAAANNLHLPSRHHLLPSPPDHRRRPSTTSTVSFCDWDASNPPPHPPTIPPPTAPSLTLSPISRYILDSLRRNNNRWGPPVLSDLSKLRRVTPNLVAELLRSTHLPAFPSTQLFHWAGKQKGYRHTYAAYNALAYCLNRSGKFRAADQVLELMQAQGKPPTEKQFEILIRFHADASRGLRVYNVYDKMRRKFDVKPRVYLYNRIMDALVKTGHLDLALKVHEDFRKDGLKEEGVTFMILAKGLCKGGRVEEALEVLGRMRSECCKPDVFAYTALVKVLVAEGWLDGCLSVWEEMERDGVVPDAMAYTTLVMGLCGGGRVEEGYRVFRDMQKKDLLVDRAAYGALVDGFVKVGKVGRGCELLNEMVREGYRVDLGIYDSLIAGMCSAGRVDKADKLFHVVVKEGLVPGFDTLRPILMAYAEAGEMDLLVGLVHRYHELGLPIIDYLVKFFSVFVTDGDQALKAVEVFETLKLKGYCSVSIYNVLIDSLHENNKVERALSLFEEMNNSKDFKPDSSTYSSVIPCFVDSGDVRGACSCYTEMKEWSWIPSIVSYFSLVKGLCKIKEINAAITLVKDCLGNVESGPMEFKYALAVLHASKSGSAEKVLGILNEMMEQQAHLPEDIIYCSIVHGFCKYSYPKEAKKVFEELRKQGILAESKLIMYEDLLKEHLMRMTAGLVLSGLKFFDLESKLKLTSRLEYKH